MGIELYNNNRPKIWAYITQDHLVNHDNNNALLVVDSPIPVTFFLSDILAPGFSCTIIQKGTGTVTLATVGAVTLESSQGITTTAVPNDMLKVYSHLPNVFICEAIGSQSGGGGTGGGVKKYVAADFADATNITDPWLLTGGANAVFWNNIPRYLENDEWQLTATGIEILVPGFDSAGDNPTFYVSKLTAGGGGGGGV